MHPRAVPRRRAFRFVRVRSRGGELHERKKRKRVRGRGGRGEAGIKLSGKGKKRKAVQALTGGVTNGIYGIRDGVDKYEDCS